MDAGASGRGRVARGGREGRAVVGDGGGAVCGSAGEAGLTVSPDALTCLCHVADLCVVLGHVAVDRLQGVAVVEHDAIAVNAEIGGIHDAAVVGGVDGAVLDVG